MTDRARIERHRPADSVSLRPKEGQSAESIERDFERSFALSDKLRAEGTERWNSHYRWIGPVKFMAYKEVGPPPWRWPRIGVKSKGKFIRFIVGWRSTAYALCILWTGAEGAGSDG